MTITTSPGKSARAAALTPATPTAPTPGTLDVLWESHFDRLCYDVSASGLARRHSDRYETLLTALTTSTGCTEEELLTHGHKVRSVLFFAEDQLGRQGVLANLVGAQQIPYRLAPVAHAF